MDKYGKENASSVCYLISANYYIKAEFTSYHDEYDATKLSQMI